MSRRDFIHDGALIVAGTGLGVLAGVELARNQKPNVTINTGINILPDGLPGASPGGKEASPEARRKASLQIFKDIVRGFINTDHDYDFWSSLDDFLRTAPDEELQKQIEGDITGRDGVLDVVWPKDVPINKHEQPIIKLALYQNIRNSSSAVTRFEMRLNPDGKINTFREAFGKSETIIKQPEEMRELLISVFKIDELKENKGWVTSYGKEGDAVAVTKVVHKDKNTITASMNDYGYVFLTVVNTYPEPLSPAPKPVNEAKFFRS